MKIIRNNTAYDTAFLRRVMRAAYYRDGVNAEHKRWFKTLRVEVSYSRSRNQIRWDFVQGEDWVVLRLRLPRIAITEEEVAQDVAEQLRGLPKREAPRIGVLAAELREALRSGRNARPDGNFYYAPLAWAEKQFGVERLPFAERSAAKPAKEDVQRERYKRVLALEKKWLSRQKLVNTKLKKLRTKRRYYERQLEVSDASV